MRNFIILLREDLHYLGVIVGVVLGLCVALSAPAGLLMLLGVAPVLSFLGSVGFWALIAWGCSLYHRARDADMWSFF